MSNRAMKPAKVTAATMPTDYITKSVILVPTLRQRVEKARRSVLLASTGCRAVYDADCHNKDSVLKAVMTALDSVDEELYFVLHHPEGSVLDVTCPSEEDWDHYQRTLEAPAGGAR